MRNANIGLAKVPDQKLLQLDIIGNKADIQYEKKLGKFFKKERMATLI